MTGKRHLGSLLVVATLLLAGCGGLLGGGENPAALYRFGNGSAPPAAPDGARVGPVRSVSYRGAVFPVESRGDRILTARGSNVAYVADARWIAPAAELFDTALKREFARSLPGARLIDPIQGPRTDFALSIDVRRFEASYEGAEAPVVAMDANVKLIRWIDRTIIGEWTFSSRKPATENRVAAIVAAYDEATTEIIGQIQGAVSRFAGNAPVPVS